MKIVISVLVFILSVNAANSQTDASKAQSGEAIEMLFPEGKTKALILSYDDGRTEDRQLVKLMNQYGLKGTFHLNSNKLGASGYLSKAEIKTLFEGHEVSVHTANHPNLTALSKIDVVYEVVEDRRELERLIGSPIRGMAYPFGNYNASVIDVLRGLGIAYSRTVKDTHGFRIPDDFLEWHPTVHQFAKAYWEPDNTENDKKELAQFYKLIADFSSTKELALLDIWGHSWEMGNDQNKWNETEKFFKLLANNPEVHSTTHIDLADYIHAFQALQFSVEKNMVINPSSLTVYFKKSGQAYSILPGQRLVLSH